MIKLTKKNNAAYYIDYDGNNLEDYLEFAKYLSTAPSRSFDDHVLKWYCSNVDAQKIQDELNNRDIGSMMKLKPYNYQRQAIAFCIKQSCGIIHLPCGAGKTPIGLGAFLELRKRDESIRGMFVVKAALKDQWFTEVSKFTDLRANVLYTLKKATAKYESRIRKKEKELEKLSQDASKETDQVVAVKKEIEDARKEQRKTFAKLFDTEKYDIFVVNYETILDPMVRIMLHQKVKADFWYIDEIDCIKSNTALRSRAIYEFNKAKYRYGATATPIRKNPKDLFGIFSFINPLLFPNEKVFDRTYLKFYYGRISGSQNEEQLAEKVEPYIFKRTFEQIADQLPQQMVYQIDCMFTDKQKDMWKKLSKEIDDLGEQKKAMFNRFTPQQLAKNVEYKRVCDGISARQTFAQMLADSEDLLKMSESNMAKQYITNSRSDKVEKCIALTEKIIQSGQKVCIFSRYLGTQDILKKAFAKSSVLKNIKTNILIGGMSAEARKKSLYEHNNLNDHAIILASDAAEAGINLSRTGYMIEFDLADSAAKQTQRHGRIQRADSIHKKVVVYQLMTKDSWDEIAMKIVNKKQGYADRILS